jgi:hypothetical protein
MKKVVLSKIIAVGLIILFSQTSCVTGIENNNNNNSIFKN